SQLRKIHKEIKELNAKMADSMLEGILSVRKILTPEQLSKFHKAMPGMGKMGHRMGDRRGPPDSEGGRDCSCKKERHGRGTPPDGMMGPMMGPPPDEEEGLPEQDKKSDNAPEGKTAAKESK
ncbi:MAG TPA: hypothetical protein PLL10_05150, partial [Elusimicrobiales bacterium]|nr:hypothetical protein [Elusimicrobiales bacterium]